MRRFAIVLRSVLFCIAVVMSWNVQASPQRIVSLKPNITEILFAIGAGDQVVGVTDFCNYPPAATAKARIGGHINPSFESIVALSPDLVIGQAVGSAEAVRRLQDLKIPTLILPFETLGDLEESIVKIGQRVGRQEAATVLSSAIQNGLSPKQQSKLRPKILVVVGRTPLYVVGPHNFLHELLVRSGAENLAADSKVPFPQFSEEALVARRPDIILDLSMGSEATAERRENARKNWKRFSTLPAVQNNRILFPDADLFLRPGPRLPLAYEELSRVISETNSKP